MTSAPPDAPPVIPELTITPVAESAIAAIIGQMSGSAPPHEGGAVQGITAAEAGSVMDWLVGNIVEQIELYHQRSDQSWKDFAVRKCVSASRRAMPFLARLPGGGAYHFNMEHYSGIQHGAIVVKLPVLAPAGNGFQRTSYLLDPTFAQFSPPHDVGKRLAETPAGKALANALFSHGYAELNEETAALYVKAFQPSPHPDGTQRQLLEASDHAYLRLLHLPAMGQEMPLKRQHAMR